MPKKKMWVEWEDGSDLSKSHKKPGAKSPLTRDTDTNELGQVTLEDIEDDDPEPEVAAAGHDRTIINIKPEHLDAWLNPTSDLEAIYRIFDDKRHPFYEHRLAA